MTDNIGLSRVVRNPPVTYRCDHCGVQKTVKHSQYNRCKKHYCSIKCGNTAKAMNSAPLRKRPLVCVTCLFCGNINEVRDTRSHIKYCGWECFKSHDRLVLNDSNNKRPWKHGRSYCPVCGKQKGSRYRTCSMECINILRRKTRKTDETKLIRSSSKYVKWRNFVINRDGGKCVECGSVKNLHVDHVIPMAAIMFKHNINNKEQAYGCEELWDINNGRVLCRMCHVSTETYGSSWYYKRHVQSLI